jgi:enamine deaminase RidA (YjgF/YER057c/UK114 family)
VIDAGLGGAEPPPPAAGGRGAAPAGLAPGWAADRERFGSGAPWEARVGYSRAVRVGPFVHVAGTTGLGPDGRPVPGGMYAQARRAFEIAAEALARAGASVGDVVRTRMYVTDAARWEEAGRAHGELFAEVRPVTTCVVVAALVDPEMLVEVEVEAIVGGRGG